MKTILLLAIKSLANRRMTSTLTIMAIALSMTLLLVVERIRAGAREGFTGVISQTDVIAGARTSPVQLLLQSIFQIGSASNNMSPESWNHFKQHPAVAWTIPLSMGDSHRGFRVIATNNDFFTHYRFRKDASLKLASGHTLNKNQDVVLGASVAKALKYRTGTEIILAHGLAKESFVKHDSHPFIVAGVLEATGTPFDQSLFITLEAMHGLHAEGAEATPASQHHDHEHEHDDKSEHEQEHEHMPGISALLIGTKARTDALALQREIQTYNNEALTAVLPGMTLAQLWQMTSYAEEALRAISFLVIIVGLLSMVVALYNSLNERRREMAILRALGARPWMITAILLTEATLITGASVLIALFATYAILIGASGFVTSSFGLNLPVAAPGLEEWGRILAMFAIGIAMAAIPAWRAYRNTLVDGLTIRI